MKHVKLIALSLSLAILSVFVFVGVANAQSFKAGETITVAANETVDSMLFAGGNNIDIAGIVNGDVYCAGKNVNISGTVKGDVFCAGQTITISGSVEGSVRLAGQSVTLSGAIGNSATIGAQDLIIEKDSVISRDLLGGSQNVIINGEIKRDIVAGSMNLTINGQVGRDITGDLSSIIVGSAGQIGGTVDYIGTSDPSINIGGKIIGTVTRTAPKQNSRKADISPMSFTIGWFIYMLIAAAVVAVALAGLFPRILNESTSKTAKTLGKTALVGAIGMLLAPTLIVILLMTVIGIPLAILALTAWIMILMLSAPFASYLLGRTILHDSKQPIVIMLLGVSILTITYFIPIIGFITIIATHLFGTGIILIQSKKLFLSPSTKKS